MGSAVKRADHSPVETAETMEMHAGFMAAFERIAAVPVRDTLIDKMSSEEWKSDEAALWNINLGCHAA